MIPGDKRYFCVACKLFVRRASRTAHIRKYGLDHVIIDRTDLDWKEQLQKAVQSPVYEEILDIYGSQSIPPRHPCGL
ncbi:hypothetical protein ADUPG1_013076 [Aduncisulcus paluster]|uniref:Uncharacterized protein n=1 Tax=Aduncisulcus paluster TaxID=2918883 RepID=A0ABQ5K1N8_9EUKA|nr:hypothetical protein ADUPG1_013076 [Aduncisulcus paluster]